MYLRKNNLYLIFFFIFLLQKPLASKEVKIETIKNYLGDLKLFSASFIQSDNGSLSEGKFFIGNERVRVEYINPSKILIILDKDKAMYYNYDLDEDEFFNPKDTNAWFLYDMFNSLEFFNDAELIKKENYLILKKVGINQNIRFKIDVFFENAPLIIRKIEFFFNDQYLSLSIFDHKYNETFNKKFFKLINPSLLN